MPIASSHGARRARHAFIAAYFGRLHALGLLPLSIFLSSLFLTTTSSKYCTTYDEALCCCCRRGALGCLRTRTDGDYYRRVSAIAHSSPPAFPTQFIILLPRAGQTVVEAITVDAQGLPLTQTLFVPSYPPSPPRPLTRPFTAKPSHLPPLPLKPQTTVSKVPSAPPQNKATVPPYTPTLPPTQEVCLPPSPSISPPSFIHLQVTPSPSRLPLLPPSAQLPQPRTLLPLALSSTTAVGRPL